MTDAKGLRTLRKDAHRLKVSNGRLEIIIPHGSRNKMADIATLQTVCSIPSSSWGGYGFAPKSGILSALVVSSESLNIITVI